MTVKIYTKELTTARHTMFYGFNKQIYLLYGKFLLKYEIKNTAINKTLHQYYRNITVTDQFVVLLNTAPSATLVNSGF